MSLQHPADFKRCFYDHVYQHYPSMRAWAKTNGFNHNHVSMLLNGHCQGWRGEVRKIRQAIEQIMGKPMPSGKKRHKK
ncbi:hypothetical protein [Symbiopectobacterium sp. RP]|uniref:hypothetical protein n=1 Tax=Symbiopectobacterium sp. RP TaxID=3248553 RepID=UPI003D2709F3